MKPIHETSQGQLLFAILQQAIEDVKPVEMQKLPPKAIKKTRNKLRELIQSRKAREQVKQGPFDEAYYSALDMLDGEPLETGKDAGTKKKPTTRSETERRKCRR